jgi:POT family proton-dependent oligopeptide transporter
MKSTVQAIALFTSAVSSALGQALVGLSEDPLLVWNYGTVAIIAMIGGIGFYLTFRKADRDEDALNNQVESNFIGTNDGAPEEKVVDLKVDEKQEIKETKETKETAVV